MTGKETYSSNRIKYRVKKHTARPLDPVSLPRLYSPRKKIPGACLVIPVDSPLPCHTHPQGYCQGTGNRNADVLDTHLPSAKGKTT